MTQSHGALTLNAAESAVLPLEDAVQQYSLQLGQKDEVYSYPVPARVMDSAAVSFITWEQFAKLGFMADDVDTTDRKWYCTGPGNEAYGCAKLWYTSSQVGRSHRADFYVVSDLPRPVVLGLRDALAELRIMGWQEANELAGNASHRKRREKTSKSSHARAITGY